MYTKLMQLMDKYKNKTSSLLLIGGDFNAKVGTRTENELNTCMGRYARGRRNNSGQQLI